MWIYRAIHNETGEIIEGNSKELAKALKVVQSTINKIALQHGVIKTHWKIQKAEQVKRDYKERAIPVCDVEKTQPLPRALCEEWDAVTAPFKKRSMERRTGQHE